MISLIKFATDELYLPKEEVEGLNLNYIPIARGTRLGYNSEGKLANFTWKSYKEVDVECYLDADGNYIDTVSGERISNGYHFFKAPDMIYKTHVKVLQEQLVDLMLFAPICKYPFTILKSVVNKDAGMLAPFNQLEEKINTLTDSLKDIRDYNFNQRCDVHIGGGLLVTFNDTMLLEDSCTDVLQLKVNEGWRVMAVCVQPDQRRPDYVLGRYNPKLEIDTGAKRG